MIILLKLIILLNASGGYDNQPSELLHIPEITSADNFPLKQKDSLCHRFHIFVSFVEGD